LLFESFIDEMILAAPDDLEIDIPAMAAEPREFYSALADADWNIEAVPKAVMDACFADLDDSITYKEYNAANCGTLAGSDSPQTSVATVPATTAPPATVAPTTTAAAESADPPLFTPAEIDDLLADPAERLEMLAP
jgi:hypothetical protein